MTDERASCWCENGGGNHASGGPYEHIHRETLGCPTTPTPNPEEE